jgi:CBS domain-containing protein
MARNRGELDDRDFYERERRLGREAPWGYDDPLRPRRDLFEQRGQDFSRGHGERAEYDNDEPRYSESRGRFRDEGLREDRYRPAADEYRERGTARQYASERSRLRCRDIMTRDLVVATRDTSLREVAIMMKQEDTGVIPVVEYQTTAGNGRTNAEETHHDNRTYGRGKLIGLITDRDIVIRAVAEDKECATTRAEDAMSTDITTARPNDRVVEVIRKMGQKQVRRIPVTGEDGRLLGMISMADIAIETEADQELADALEEISKGSSFWRSVFG